MKTKLIIVLLVSLLSFAIEAKPKKNSISLNSFIPVNHTMDGFHGLRISMDVAEITNDWADGVQAPLAFEMKRPENMTDLEFRETIIFVVENLAEAFHN